MNWGVLLQALLGQLDKNPAILTTILTIIQDIVSIAKANPTILLDIISTFKPKTP
jgi:hypothetical protein